MPEVVINCRLEWHSLAAGGQLCEICGDVIYHPRAWEPLVYSDTVKIGTIDCFVCDSCHDAAEL